jgi:hypothetical protein
LIVGGKISWVKYLVVHIFLGKTNFEGQEFHGLKKFRDKRCLSRRNTEGIKTEGFIYIKTFNSWERTHDKHYNCFWTNPIAVNSLCCKNIYKNNC